ncbi:putative uncharacterized protein C3orf49 [Heterocephalus glaber]|uniref:Uncharacterized protein n=1 Tax=Heterocephalus glaber TaxID=10181 RepID=A0AAX6S9U4_HETGA|nr:putative uncharacterized protein C3orf49 [Heterocephalus glaber]
MEKVRAAWGRILRLTRRRQPARARGEDATRPGRARARSPRPRTVQEPLEPGPPAQPRRRRRSQGATIQLDVVEAETEEITQGNALLRARRTTKRLSVTSLPSGLQKVDDLIETVTDKSMKLLAQRHAELQQCEFLGDEILQSSKQFQRMSKRTTRKYKLKNVCFPCTCCC